MRLNFSLKIKNDMCNVLFRWYVVLVSHESERPVYIPVDIVIYFFAFLSPPVLQIVPYIYTQPCD